MKSQGIMVQFLAEESSVSYRTLKMGPLCCLETTASDFSSVYFNLGICLIDNGKTKDSG